MPKLCLGGHQDLGSVPHLHRPPNSFTQSLLRGQFQGDWLLDQVCETLMLKPDAEFVKS